MRRMIILPIFIAIVISHSIAGNSVNHHHRRLESVSTLTESCAANATNSPLDSTLSEEIITACSECSAGNYFDLTNEVCTPCSNVIERGYSTVTGSLYCIECPSSKALSDDRTSCTTMTCGAACVLSLLIALVAPLLVLVGKSILISYWVKNALARERDENDKLLDAEIRKQVVNDTSQKFDTLADEKKQAVMRVINDDLQLNTVFIEWNKIKMIKTITSGAFGEVLLGEYCGGRVAIKRLLARRLCAVEVVGFAHEIHLMMNLRHPQIVQFMGVTWSSSHDICAISEYMERGDMLNVLKKKKKLTWTDYKLRMAHDVTLALRYMHSLNPPVIHRDLKSKNILVTETYGCKLSDFGLSREKVLNETLDNVGTYCWLAPEVIKGEDFNESIDVYSFGIVLVEMVTHELPYHDAIGPDGVSKLKGIALAHHVTHLGLKPSLPPNVFPEIEDLIHKCISHDPSKRPTPTEIAALLKGPMYKSISQQERVLRRHVSARI